MCGLIEELACARVFFLNAIRTQQAKQESNERDFGEMYLIYG